MPAIDMGRGPVAPEKHVAFQGLVAIGEGAPVAALGQSVAEACAGSALAQNQGLRAGRNERHWRDKQREKQE